MNILHDNRNNKEATLWKETHGLHVNNPLPHLPHSPLRSHQGQLFPPFQGWLLTIFLQTFQKLSTPCVTSRRVAIYLQGPRHSPVLPFACCIGSMLFDGCGGQCYLWCPFRIGAARLAHWGCAGYCRGHFTILAAHSPPRPGHPPHASPVFLCVRSNCYTPLCVVLVVRHAHASHVAVCVRSNYSTSPRGIRGNCAHLHLSYAPPRFARTSLTRVWCVPSWWQGWFAPHYQPINLLPCTTNLGGLEDDAKHTKRNQRKPLSVGTLLLSSMSNTAELLMVIKLQKA